MYLGSGITLDGWSSLLGDIITEKSFVGGFFFGVAVSLFIFWTVRKINTPTAIKDLNKTIAMLTKQIKDKEAALKVKDERLDNCHKKQSELEDEIRELKNACKKRDGRQ